MRLRQSPNAFSLIELLVVLTLVAVLIAMLLPALGGAREVAKSAVCSSKMRQLGIAIETYATDNHNKYPYGTWRPWTSATVTWDTLINDQMGARGPALSAAAFNFPLLMCPKDPRALGGLYGVRSYQMNTNIAGGELLYVLASAPGVPPHSLRADELPEPAGTFMLVESPNNSGRSYYPSTASCPGNQSSKLLTLTNPRYVAVGAQDAVYSANPIGATTHPNTTFNYLYADGHIKAFFPLDTDSRPGYLGGPRSGMRTDHWFQITDGAPPGGWSVKAND